MKYVLFALLLISGNVSAQISTDKTYNEILRGHHVAPLTGDLFGEQVNNKDGSTHFSQTDVSVPTNSGLRVEFTRHTPREKQGADSAQFPLGSGWEIDIPYMMATFDTRRGWDNGGGARCSGSQSGPTQTVGPSPDYNTTVMPAYLYWSGIHINIPGAGYENLLKQLSGHAIPQDGQTYIGATNGFWRVGCLPQLKNGTGEGFFVKLPNGTKYYFDWMASRNAFDVLNKEYYRDSNGDGTDPTGLLVPTSDVFLYATKVEDRHGNIVNYNFDPANKHRLTSIVSSDGARLDITYNQTGQVSEVHALGQVWKYTYGAITPFGPKLTEVLLPDQSKWTFAGDMMWWYAKSPILPAAFYDNACEQNATGYRSQDPAASYNLSTLVFTHPSGAQGTFVLRSLIHGSDNTPGGCGLFGSVMTDIWFGSYGVPSAYLAKSLISKKITGPGLADQTWSYSYVPSWSFAKDCTSGCTTTTRITNPSGDVTEYVYGNSYTGNQNLLLQERLLRDGIAQKTMTYTYNTTNTGSYPEYYGEIISSTNGFVGAYGNPNVVRIKPLAQRVIQQEGVAFTQTVNSFDAFARPLSATKFSPWNSKIEVTEYHDNLSLWVLGQVQRSTTNGIEYNRTEFNAQALPWKRYAFDKLQQTLTYNADGTLATAADGAGNTTTYSAWKRGIPQSITNPDSTTQSATVDDNGWITAVTDENGYVTGYGYDAVGRLTGIVYPAGDTLAGGASAYHGSWANYRALTSADWKPAGVSDGQWRKLEGTGDHITVTYYDAMWRPVLINEYDQNNVTPTLRSVRTEYDTSGRKSFESYPSSSGVPGSAGIRTFYDALDRVKRVEQDSELGVLATTTEYLSGLKVRVTNPRGKQTTTSFMAWDQPSYDLPILSEQPEGKVIQITRHPQFGWPLSMTQRNAANTLSQTRKYVYDGYAQLCKTIEPEAGATVMGYDAAGNPSWSAAGLDAITFASTTDCQHTAAFASGRASTRTYDARNRLSVLDFPDHRGKQVWTYTPDGKPASITVYNTASDPQPVVTAYNYNHRRLLTGETLTQQGWYSWAMGYAYDAYGNLASQTYPTGLTVAYAPNPLGQATQAGSYATGAQYYPNGALKQFTYGNGIVHTMTQNARQLPSQVTSSGTTNYTYNYDADGNITNIWDLARGDDYSRWMTYDDLDRLTSAGSASFGGDAWHRFTYDALDNLTSWKLAGVKDYAEYVYDAQNRLTNIRNTAGASVVGLGYDLQGNVGNKNGQTYDFDYGNRLRTVTGQESYRYDGLGRRVQTTKTDGSKTTIWQYTQSGQMAFSSDWAAPGQSNQKTHENVYLAGSVVAIIDHDWPSNAVIATKYQHTDALGSPVAVTNAAGTVVERNDYEPYGAVIGKPAYSGIGYTGHVMDGGTGLTYMQQRYYDQSIGRFLSVDPVTADGGTGGNFSRYWYANNNPYWFTDPDGRAACPNGSGGNCIDSPRTESGATPQVGPSAQQLAVDSQVKAASDSGRLSDGTRLNYSGDKEQGFSASADGTKSAELSGQRCVRCSDGSQRTSATFDASKLGLGESGGHTHNGLVKPLPGPEDGRMARATGKTAYMISPRGAFGIERTDVGYRVRLIDGTRLDAKERRALMKIIDGWNQNQGGSGISCAPGC